MIQQSIVVLHDQIAVLQASTPENTPVAKYLALMIAGCVRAIAILQHQPSMTDAHDLYSPLNAVSGFAELLLVDDYPLTADQRAGLIAIRAEVEAIIVSVKASYG